MTTSGQMRSMSDYIQWGQSQRRGCNADRGGGDLDIAELSHHVGSAAVVLYRPQVAIDATNLPAEQNKFNRPGPPPNEPASMALESFLRWHCRELPGGKKLTKAGFVDTVPDGSHGRSFVLRCGRSLARTNVKRWGWGKGALSADFWTAAIADSSTMTMAPRGG